jgi:hypothetical protein
MSVNERKFTESKQSMGTFGNSVKSSSFCVHLHADSRRQMAAKHAKGERRVREQKRERERETEREREREREREASKRNGKK